MILIIRDISNIDESIYPCVESGNLQENKIEYVAKYLKEKQIPIRIGVNGGYYISFNLIINFLI